MIKTRCAHNVCLYLRWDDVSAGDRDLSVSLHSAQGNSGDVEFDSDRSCCTRRSGGKYARGSLHILN